MEWGKARVILLDIGVPMYDETAVIQSLHPERSEFKGKINLGEDSPSPYPILNLDVLRLQGEWEYLVVNSNFFREEIDKLIEKLGIKQEKVIYLDSLDEKEFDVRYIFRENSTIIWILNYFTMKSLMPYQSCVADGLRYISSGTDSLISFHMFLTGKSWAADDIDIFLELTEKYYGYRKGENGYFLDIGANIGTTSAYVKKMMPELDIISFEPETENYRLCKINMSLNGFEEVCVENVGLSDRDSIEYLEVNKQNKGGCSIIVPQSDEDRCKENIQECHCTTLDSYVTGRGISYQDIHYIWMDTEGFEGKILQGGEKTFKKGKIPLFMEFTPKFWRKNGSGEQALRLLEEYYSFFIDVGNISEKGEVLQPIEKLELLYQNLGEGQTDIFLVK